MSVIRVGARGSPLSRIQVERIRARLAAAGHATTFTSVSTTGDLDRATPLGRFGQPAVFSRELDEALLAGRIDAAVHSLKDLPTALPEGIALAAVSVREDASDALIGRGPLRFADLRRGATVATSSLRRQAQLRRVRPDLDIVELRGNVDTRVATLDRTGDWDAIVLATAGLLRLDLGHRIGERLNLDLMLPAPGQAALAVTTRAGDVATTAIVRGAVNEERSELACVAERSLLATIEGGCHLPVAGYAIFTGTGTGTGIGTGIGTGLDLRARVASLDGTRVVDGRMLRPVTTLAGARRLGAELATELLGRGAGRILDDARAGQR